MSVRVRTLGGRGGAQIIPADEYESSMWIHKELRIAFIADPRTGSREVGYNLLKNRGFTRFLGHHGVPWGGDHPRHAKAEKSGDLWWWYNEDLYRWTFYAGHRNHFEVFHSIGRAAIGGQPPTPERFETYLWKHPALYRNAHILFPAFFEVAGCRELRFDHLRDDVDALCRRHGLRPLKDDEGHRKDSIHHTVAKPREEHYTGFLSQECREWIEETYAAEMERFGYSWQEPGDTEVPPGE